MSERKGAAGRIIKNKKKAISLETKLDILRRFDKGEKAVEIAKSVGLAPTTVRSIRDRDGEKIREAAKSATCLDAKSMTRTRSALMIRMESLLSIWIENQVAQRLPLSKTVIKTKAKSIFDDLKSKADNTSGSKNETFEASQGWFERFKVRTNRHSTALNAVSHEISNLAGESNFEGTEEANINELLTITQDQELSNEELSQLELQFANEEDDSDRSVEISEEQNLTAKHLSKAMSLIDEAMDILLQNDPDSGRSLKVSQAVAKNINCYMKMYFRLKKKVVQQTTNPRRKARSKCR